jgi:5'-nucleotidase
VTLKPLVLLTNDDGHLASGIQRLREALSRWADVIVVAPETEQSATSHSLSLHRPLRLRDVEPGLYALDGTPADCVYVAIHSIGRALPRRPDMVVSGLNHGVNLGADVFYSGTVGGAREGALRGIVSLAASADIASDQLAAAAFASDFAKALLDHANARPAPERGRPLLWNFNVPPGNGPWPLRRTVIGSRLYEDQVVFARDPRGREYLWIGGSSHSHEQVPGSDTEAHDAGFASVTPLVLDLTSAGDVNFVQSLVSSFPAASSGGKSPQ